LFDTTSKGVAMKTLTYLRQLIAKHQGCLNEDTLTYLMWT